MWVWENRNYKSFISSLSLNRNVMFNKIHSVLTHSPGCDLKLDVTKRNKHLLHFLRYGSDKINDDLNVDIFNIVKKFLHQSKRFLL